MNKSSAMTGIQKFSKPKYAAVIHETNITGTSSYKSEFSGAYLNFKYSI